MEESAAAELVELAHSDPARAFEQAHQALEDGNFDGAVESVLLRAQGEAARWVRDSSITRIRRTSREIGCARSISPTGTISSARRSSRSPDPSISRATRNEHSARWTAPPRGADGHLAAKVLFQRATILAREGQPEQALSAFDRALAQFEAYGDPRFAALTLSNRGMVLLERGLSKAATEDLEAAQRQFRRLGLHADVAWTEHNLGRAAGLRDDIVTALRRFKVSESELERLGENTAEVQVNRCEVLLQAGLYEEAEAAARAGRDSDARSTARARTGGGGTRTKSGTSRAGSIRRAPQNMPRGPARLFRKQQRVAWSLQATLVELRSEHAAGRPATMQKATTIARALSATGQRLAAAQAWAVVARRESGHGLEGLQSLNLPGDEAPLEFRLTKLEILGLDRLAHFDRPGALTATRRGDGARPTPSTQLGSLRCPGCDERPTRLARAARPESSSGSTRPVERDSVGRPK